MADTGSVCSFVRLVLCQAVSRDVLVRTEIPEGQGEGNLTLHCHLQNDPDIKMGSGSIMSSSMSNFSVKITVEKKSVISLKTDAKF